jgi:hypothetical protein
MFWCLLHGQTLINLLGLTDPVDEVIRILRNVSTYFLIDMRQHPVTPEPPNTGLLSAPTGLMQVPFCSGVQGVGLRQLACLECGFESHRRHGCLSLVSVLCCQVEVPVTS